MTRKDYILLASHIANGYREGDITDDGVLVIADALASDNGRFDRSRFMDACGCRGIVR